MYVSEFSAWVSTARQRYSSIQKLLGKRTDSYNPNRATAGQNLLVSLLGDLDTKWPMIETLQAKLLRSLFKFELGMVSLRQVELQESFDFFVESKNILGATVEKPECCYIVLNALIHIGIVLLQDDDLDSALKQLLLAEKYYIVMKEDSTLVPHVFEDFFLPEGASLDEAKNKLEFDKLYAMCLHFIQEALEKKGESLEAAKYSWRFLMQQKANKHYDADDWLAGCVILSEYLMSQNKMFEVRHLLACSRLVLKRFEETNSGDRETLETMKPIKANLAAFHLKFCIKLISKSTQVDKDKAFEFFPVLIKHQDIVNGEEELPCPVDSFEKALAVFRFAQKQADLAKEHYTWENFADQYSEIIINQSKLYDYLAEHETDSSRKCKMQKRRMDLLYHFSNKLNKVELLKRYRSILFLLGQASLDLFNLKKSAFTEESSEAAVNKLKILASKIIQYHDAYIATFKNENGVLPDVYSDDVVQSVLLSHFNVGFFQTFPFQDVVQLKECRMNLRDKYFKYVSDYVERNPQHRRFIQDELVLINQVVCYDNQIKEIEVNLLNM